MVSAMPGVPLRLELAPFGIAVVVVEPGVIGTDFGAAMVGPMMERSGGSAYAALAKRMESATLKSYAKGSGSPPTLVARTVSRALKARRPKTRYVVGKLARPMMLARKWLGDRVFDRIVMGFV